MQAVMWEVVDVNLQASRVQFSADLAAFWDARSIYQAHLQAHQVVIMPCNTIHCRAVCRQCASTACRANC